MSEENTSLDTSTQEVKGNKESIAPPPSNTQENSKKTLRLPVPYLASLVAFVGLLVTTFYSLIGLVGFALDRLITASNDTASSSTILGTLPAPDFSSYFVISQVAALVICLPATIIMAHIINKYEGAQPWRLSQKMRRGVYIAGTTLLIVALVSTAVSTVYGLLDTNLELKELSKNIRPYTASSLTENQSSAASEKMLQNTKTILQGIFNIVILGAGLFVLTNSYADRDRKAAWIVLGALSVLAIILVPYSTAQVHQKVQDKKKRNQQLLQERQERQNRQRSLNPNAFDSLFRSGSGI